MNVSKEVQDLLRNKYDRLVSTQREKLTVREFVIADLPMRVESYTSEDIETVIGIVEAGEMNAQKIESAEDEHEPIVIDGQINPYISDDLEF